MKNKRLVALSLTITFLFAGFSTGFAAKETKYTLTKEMDRVRMQHDSGYYTEEKIEKEDPHYGWGLGSFYIEGYTEVLKDEDGTPVFLKNVGNELVLGFDLKKDINKLGKDNNCSISEDTNGYDKEFEVGQTNFGKGCLIVLETDYRNTTRKPVICTDYLSAVQKKTANTKVKPFAEGDYVVALDYELQSPGLLGMAAFSDYRIKFKFKIRNSNCMVFLYNLGNNKDEITNGAVAEEGFKIDFKNSYFLTVTVTKDILVNHDGILTFDTRFNKAASDGASFTEEGLYTITVSNQYTKEHVTKKISVGHNKVLNVYAAHSGTIDPNEIAKQLDQGAEVNDQWMLIFPEAKAEDDANTQQNDYSNLRTLPSTDDQVQSARKGPVTPVNISIFALAVIGLIAILKTVEKQKQKKKEIHDTAARQNELSAHSAPTIEDVSEDHTKEDE